MKQPMRMSAVLRFSRTIFFLLLVTCSCPLARASLAASNALRHLGDFSYPYGSIFSPLLKALAEHGGSRWNPELKRRMKPEHKYMKYLTEVYKKSSRVQRSLDGDTIYNTVRLIKPQDECLAESDKGEQLDLTHFVMLQCRGLREFFVSWTNILFGYFVPYGQIFLICVCEDLVKVLLVMTTVNKM